LKHKNPNSKRSDLRAFSPALDTIEMSYLKGGIVGGGSDDDGGDNDNILGPKDSGKRKRLPAFPLKNK